MNTLRYLQAKYTYKQIGNVMELRQIRKEHALLIDELTKLGAGYSLVERALMFPACRNSLEEVEKECGSAYIRKLCVAIMARYLILVEANCRYFNYVTENHVHRALFNNGIDDKDISYWMMFPRQAYFESDPKYPMPKDLEDEIVSLRIAAED